MLVTNPRSFRRSVAGRLLRCSSCEQIIEARQHKEHPDGFAQHPLHLRDLLHVPVQLLDAEEEEQGEEEHGQARAEPVEDGEDQARVGSEPERYQAAEEEHRTVGAEGECEEHPDDECADRAVLSGSFTHPLGNTAAANGKGEVRDAEHDEPRGDQENAQDRTVDALQPEREIDHVHPDQEDGRTHDRIRDDTAQRVREPVEG